MLYLTLFWHFTARKKVDRPNFVNFSECAYFIRFVSPSVRPWSAKTGLTIEPGPDIYTLSLVLLNKLRCHTHF